MITLRLLFAKPNFKITKHWESFSYTLSANHFYEVPKFQMLPAALDKYMGTLLAGS